VSGPRRDVSKSMVALLLSMAGLTLLGLSTAAPAWLGRETGLADVQPGLLVVDEQARGIATLGGGVTAALYSSGLRLSHEGDILTETVNRGSLVSAVVGSLADGATPEEHVTRSLDHVRIRELQFLPGRATYTGEVYDDQGSLPLEIRLELAGPVVRLGVSIPGADAVVIHLDHKPATLGIPPGLPDRNLRRRAFWVDPATDRNTPVLSTVLGTDVAVGPEGVARGMDLRSQGRHDVHVWSDSAVLGVSSRARPTP
jgi:hypothetical protein